MLRYFHATIIILHILLLAGCSAIKNRPQESQFLKVEAGGYFLDTKRQAEEYYGLVINFKNLPDNAKYLIADFELPNNQGLYERKIFPAERNRTNFFVKSDPIYGLKQGVHHVKLYLAEDKKGEKVIDQVDQALSIGPGISKGRDYTTQYTLFNGEKEIKKLLVVYPNDRKQKLITAEIPNDFKIGHAAVSLDESTIEYVPNNETVFNWSKIITLMEMKPLQNDLNKPYILAFGLGKGMYDRFYKSDEKKMQLTYAGMHNGQFINVETPNFQELIKSSDEVGVFVDYVDKSSSKRSRNQREYLVARIVKSDISIWMIQCTVKYDEKWPKEKIRNLKKEADKAVAFFRYAKTDHVDNLERIAKENGMENFRIESRRLDNRDLNSEFKETNKAR